MAFILKIHVAAAALVSLLWCFNFIYETFVNFDFILFMAYGNKLNTQSILALRYRLCKLKNRIHTHTHTGLSSCIPGHQGRSWKKTCGYRQGPALHAKKFTPITRAHTQSGCDGCHKYWEIPPCAVSTVKNWRVFQLNILGRTFCVHMIISLFAKVDSQVAIKYWKAGFPKQKLDSCSILFGCKKQDLRNII